LLYISGKYNGNGTTASQSVPALYIEVETRHILVATRQWQSLL